MKSGYGVELSAKDRQRIAAMLGKGRESARVLRRAMVVRQLDRGEKIVEVAAVGVSRKTVEPQPAIPGRRAGVGAAREAAAG